MKKYNIEIQNPETGEVETREYTMVSTSSLRSRTSALRFQKSLMDIRLLKETMSDVDDADKSMGYDTALKMADMQQFAYHDLCTNVLIGDWSGVDFSLIDEEAINQVLTDFFSLYNTKNSE